MVDIQLSILKIVAAVVIVLIGLIVGRVIGKLVRKGLHELEIDSILNKYAKIRIPIEESFGRIVSYVIYFIAIILALNQLGLSTFILRVILWIILVLVVAFVILAFKDFIPNLAAGFFIHHKLKLKKGNIIEVAGVKGKIINMNLVETTIKTKNKEEVIVPNAMLNKNIVVKKK